VRIMKNLSFIFLLFCSVQVFAQTKGITYQAVIYNPTGESLPGVNNANAPMANKNVCLQFSIVDASSQIEYQELISTTTDEFGMVNLVIGNGTQTSGYATSFSTIAWSVDQKSMKVALDIQGQCTDFVDISNQKFEAVPYAFSANTADNISGILPIENGGTNASTVLGAKTNLGLENVDNTSDLNKPISTATQAALDLKEDQVNKSTATTLGTSDVLYPTQNAVKTYVDASTTNINAAIANEAAIRAAADNVLTTNLATEVTNRINGDNTLTTNLATEVSNRINADNVLTTNLATEVLNRTNADVILTNNLAAEVTNRTNADLLKEDLVNKSTATTLGTSDVLYPTQNAVKTYVDATSTSNTTALNNEAAIRAAADVVLTNDLATEVTNRTNADLLKENTANKSTATTLGTSNVLFPTQNAVKTYVDASATTNAAAVTNEAAIRAAADVVLTNNLATEVTNRTNADLLKENLANKSTNTALGTSDVFYPTQNAVKSYVDAGAVNATNALNNEAAIRAAADATLTTNLATEVTNRSIEDNNLATSIATEVTNRTNADLLKENLTNKSTDVVVDGNSNTKYPTVKSIKDYVDAAATTNSGAISNEAAIRAAADLVLTNNLATEVTNRTNADLLKEDLVNKSNNLVFDGTSTIKYPTVKTVKDYVDLNAATAATNLSNEAAARSAADNTLTTNLNIEALSRINGDLLKENTANKSTTTTLGNSDVLFPTQNAVKTYVDANTTSNSTAINNEAAIRAAADVVLTNDLAAEVAARTAADVLLTNDIAAEAAARTAADLLKENTANKSTATTLGNSDVLFPTQNAVKTYVDATSTSNTAALNNEAVIRAAADVVLTNDIATEVTNRTNADLLKENTANKSTSTSLGTSNVLFPTQNAVKTYVDANVSSNSASINNEAAIRAAADVVLTNDIAAEAAARTAADLLKENTANKSTTTTLGTSDVLYPTQNAVKTYVDAQVAMATIADADATTKGKLQLAGDLSGTAAAPTVPGLALKAPIASPTFTGTPAAPTAAAGTNTTQVATTEFVTGAIATATIPDATTTAKGKIQLAGDLSGTAALPVVAANAITTSKIVDANVTDAKIATVSGSKVTGNITGSAANVTGTVAVANGGTGATTAAGALTNLGAAPIASPTFTGTVTSPIYASTPQALTDGTTISWNPTNGLNASVTLGGNRTLSFASTPAVGSYGTLIVTQDATGNRTITLPSTSNKVLGSASTTTIALSTAPNAKDILNFYYDGTNCYWNIGQGYGTAAAAVVTNLATGVSGTLPVANGGSGSTTLTGYVKGNGTSAMTANATIPVVDVTGAAPIASPTFTGTPAAPTAAAGTNTTQVATTEFVTGAIATATIPDATTTAKGKIQLAGDLSGTAALPVVAANAITTSKILDANVTDAKIATVSGSKVTGNITGSAANVTGTVAVANGGSGATTAAGALTNLGAAPIASPTFTGTPAAPTAAAGTNTTQVATTEFVTGAIATATIPDATTTAKGKIQLAGDLSGTAALPVVAANAITTSKILDANVTDAKIATVSGSKVTGNITGSAANVTGTVAVANGGTGATTAAGALTNLGAAPIASPTFTGTVTSPIYASTPQALTDGTTISWNPTNGLNASVTLGGNRTLSFASTPAVGSYGTLIVTQDATGNRTITLPSTSNKVLGSASTTTIALSTAPNAKDILNFYYDGTNCYWNIGQGYGTAAAAVITNLATGVSGTLPVANGGSGSTTLTGYVKGNGTSAMTANATIPVADVTGAAPIASPTFTGTPAAPTAAAGTNTTQVATTEFVTGAIATATIPDATTTAKGKIQLAGDLSGTAALPVVAANAITTSKIVDANVTDAKIATVSGSKVTGNITGSAANVTGTVAVANGGSGATTAAGALTNLGAAPIASPTFTGTPAAPTAAAGTNTTQVATTEFVTGAIATATIPDATTTAKGKIQLAGDLSGTAALPVVAANAITTSKIVDANVTDAKIATVSGSKVTGNITGSAANVTGTVAVANGGTGATTAAGALTNLGAAPIASPTFTGTVTSPIYASTPQALTDGTTIFMESNKWTKRKCDFRRKQNLEFCIHSCSRILRNINRYTRCDGK
jgi:hypothetical protein